MPLTYPLVKQGQSTKVAFASATAFLPEFDSLDIDDEEFEKVDVTKLSTSGGKEYIQSALYEPGMLKGKVHFNPAIRYPLTNTTDTITVYYPTNGTDTADTDRERFSQVGFYMGMKHVVSKSPTLMTGDITIQFTGARSYTAQS